MKRTKHIKEELPFLRDQFQRWNRNGMSSTVNDGEVRAARNTGNTDGTLTRLADRIAYAAGNVYNALAYHATGTVGVDADDDTAAIQAAISAAQTAGRGRVLATDGTWLINAKLLHNSGKVVLAGQSKRGTVLQGAFASEPGAIIEFSGVTGSVVENLTVVNGSDSAFVSNGILFTACIDSHARNVHVEGEYEQATITDISMVSTTATVTTSAAHGYTTGDRALIEDTGTGLDGFFLVTVTAPTTFTYTAATTGLSTSTGRSLSIFIANGIHFAPSGATGSSRCTAEQCSFEKMYVALRFGEYAKRCHMTGCDVDDTFRGVMWDSGTGDATYCVARGNTFEDCHHIVGKMEGSAFQNSFIDNDCIDYGEHVYGLGTDRTAGFFIEGDNSVVANNRWSSAAFEGLGTIAVQVGTGGRVEGNIITDVAGYGVYIKSGATDAQVVGNRIYNAASRGVQVEQVGAGLLVEGNHIYGGGFNIEIRQSNNVSVKGNTLQAATSRGIFVLGSEFVEISGNKIISPAGAGIYLSDSSDPCADIIINANQIYDAGATGIHATTTTATAGQRHLRVSVTNNQIHVDTPASHLAIDLNRTEGCSALGNTHNSTVAASPTGINTSSATNITTANNTSNTTAS